MRSTRRWASRETSAPTRRRGARAIEIATNRVASPDLARVFRIFGRPERVAICDCERPSKPALPQTLFLMTDAALLEKIKSGRLKDLVASDRCDAEVVEELFLATLSRLAGRRREPGRPSTTSAPGPTGRAAFADVLWALINTREFVLNH